MTSAPSVRAELLDLLPVAGRRFGLGRRALDHLAWLIRHTRVQDWEPGNRAVVYLSVSETAAQRGVTVRQIHNYEQAIAEAFGLRMEIAYNRRRYGRRDSDGRIAFAFGFELTGLRVALPALRQAGAEIEDEHAKRRVLKRRLAAVRGQVRKLADAVYRLGDEEQILAAQEIAESVRGRLGEGVELREVERRLAEALAAQAALETLLLQGKSGGSDVKTSDASEINFRHIHPTTHHPTDDSSSLSSPSVDREESGRRPWRRSCAGLMRASARPGLCLQEEAVSIFGTVNGDSIPSIVDREETGAHRVRVKLARLAASDHFRDQIPLARRAMSEEDLVEAARSLLVPLGINASAWREACGIIGPYPAALCVLITDRAAAERGISSPGGYFRAMARKALSGELNIDRSIFGFLDG
ncbi:MAG: plasmid replication protein RepC [Rhodospirillaceae bacterium]|nr:plasmid replication protein RepC [Rhodospirillaceae bacterium]